MKPDTAFNVARDPSAPPSERYDANAELQQRSLSEADQLTKRMEPIVEFMRTSYEDQEFNKALVARNVIPFPSKAVREGKEGMQSVFIDDNQVGVMGDYYEKPGSFGFEAMRQMVDQTPILASIVLTRIRQVQRFCRVQENGKGPGFEIRLRDRDAHASSTNKDSIRNLQNFFTNCGWESNPRLRSKLKRDNLTSLMSKLVRDSLTMDAAAIETEFKKDRSLGMDGIYAVDGATIRLCTEAGYRGDDEIRALQVVQGQIRSLYTFDDLIYVPRNPRTDVLVGGYGMGEPELLIKIVTHLLNAMTYNGKFFDANQIPKGLLHLSGDYDANDLAAFRRQWAGMVKGINNSWSMPVMVSKDQESKASFEKFGVEIDDMQFAKWTSFLTSVSCAVYGIAPDEINIESFSSKNGGLGNGNDTEEKLASSKDKGLRPLLSYFEDLWSDFVVADFSDEYCFRFTGLDEEDEKQKFERSKLILTVNEMRAQDSLDKITEAWGDAPLNPSLIGAWQAEQQQGQEDYGTPGADGQADQGGDDQQQGGQDFGGDDEQDFGQAPDDQQTDQPEGDQPDAEQVTKSFGLPVFVIEP